LLESELFLYGDKQIMGDEMLFGINTLQTHIASLRFLPDIGGDIEKILSSLLPPRSHLRRWS
jgi:hypothetical protein